MRRLVVVVVVVVVVWLVGCWLLVVGCCVFLWLWLWWLLVVGCWLLVAGCWLLVVGCWLLVAGCWLLVAGCWLLVVGCWLFGCLVVCLFVCLFVCCCRVVVLLLLLLFVVLCFFLTFRVFPYVWVFVLLHFGVCFWFVSVLLRFFFLRFCLFTVFATETCVEVVAESFRSGRFPVVAKKNLTGQKGVSVLVVKKSGRGPEKGGSVFCFKIR